MIEGFIIIVDNARQPTKPPAAAYLRGCDSFPRVSCSKGLSEIVPAVQHGAAAPIYVGEPVRVLFHAVFVVHLFSDGAHQISDSVHLPVIHVRRA